MYYLIYYCGSPEFETVKSRELAIRMAKDYQAKGPEGTLVSVVAVEEDGTHQSRTKIWPEVGETFCG